MKIEIKPLSVNEAWQGKRFKTAKYLSYEKELMLLLPKINIPSTPLVLSVNVGYSNKLSDIDNCIKPFQDILQKKYGNIINRIKE